MEVKIISKAKEKITLMNKCIEIYKNDLMNQGVFNYDEKLIIGLFINKSISELKKWLKVNDKLKQLTKH